MRIIETHLHDPASVRTQTERDWIYNGLDCCVTAEVLDMLLPQLDPSTSATYDWSRRLQGPALEMRLRGILIDKQRKAEVIDEYYETLEILERNLERIVLEGVGLPKFNWRSNDDLKELFYGRLKIPVIKKRGKPTCDREALEKMEAYLIARPIVLHLFTMRDIGKKLGMLRTEIDPDGRMRTSYNIAGTNTGRFSSSFSEFGTGTNLQNTEESLRSIFIADPGMKMAKFDGKQIQSRVVGAIEWNLFKDGVYLDACEDSDLHVVVAKMCWPELPWTGDPIKDKDVSETIFYRWYTHRFMCKKLGHGSNFGGLPPTLAAQTKLPVNIVRAFQPRYFKAFPAHHEWHEWVDDTLRQTGIIHSITGRKRRFWGRRSDDSTLREAIAYDPQASESFIVNSAMLNIWHARDATLLMHDHDALTIQYREEQEDEIIPKIMAQLRVEVPLKHGRSLVIPYDCKTGWNRGDFHSENNPSGLKDYYGTDTRRRPEKVHILDR